MSYLEEEILEYLDQEIYVLESLNINRIRQAAIVLHEAIANKKNIYCFGNGGSASTASHLTNDFNKILRANCICLNDNVPTIMAVANDISYDEIFRFQLENKIKAGDIVIAISGSGNSKNVINGVSYAKDHNAIIIAFTGFDGGVLYTLADINLHASINNMQITEDIHLMFNHLLVSVLSKFL